MSNDERSTAELRSQHQDEASALGWRCVFSGGQVKGDLLVSILPPPHLVTSRTRARTYLYRQNPLSGKYRLVKKDA